MSDHKKKMEHVREVYEKRKAAATREKGLVIVHTGNGKGKSTAAWGLVIRALGHGMRVAVIQFIKGAIETAETRVFERFGDRVEWHRMGEGFTWITQDAGRDREVAAKAFAKAKELLARDDLDMVVLDEILVAIKKGQLEEAPVVEALAEKPASLHVVLTGRGASERIVDAADLVSEVKMVKHPYRVGVKPQRGVEF